MIANLIFTYLFRAEGEEPGFLFSPHLLSEEGEIEYLRKVSEVFILFFLPQGYSQPPAKDLLREIITTKSNKIIN